MPVVPFDSCVFLLCTSVAEMFLLADIRAEAVLQALALNKKQSMVPMPSKRKSGIYCQNQQSSHAERGTGLFSFSANEIMLLGNAMHVFP